MLNAIRQALTLSYLRHLASTQAGRGFILSQVADAESSGESQVFEQALAKVDDPQLAGMIRKHQADEIRHAALFLACEARNGLPPRTVPAELKLIDRLDQRLGHPLSRSIESSEGVMRAYLLLQVLEERAISQFEQFIAAFREVDPQTAAVFEEVRADEERHLKYCHAISRRYAPDETTRLSALARMRQAEAEAYRENQAANMQFTMARLGSASQSLPVTSFFKETAHLLPATA
jgi:rubrerythrin